MSAGESNPLGGNCPCGEGRGHDATNHRAGGGWLLVDRLVDKWWQGGHRSVFGGPVCEGGDPTEAGVAECPAAPAASSSSHPPRPSPSIFQLLLHSAMRRAVSDDTPWAPVATSLTSPDAYRPTLPSLPPLPAIAPSRPAPVPPSYRPLDPGSGHSLCNAAVVATVGFTGKLLMSGLQRIHAYNLDRLHRLITDRSPGTPLLTVSNHKSVMDDPFLLASLLPPRLLLRPARMRYSMCAVDICFRSEFLNRFFIAGKVLPIRRGAGLQQPELARAAEKLARGEWLHVYPEGKVNQHCLGLIRHGIGKLIALASAWREEPVPDMLIVPMYHEGMEHVMPQDDESNELVSMVPRIGRDIFVIVGEPFSVREIVRRRAAQVAAAVASVRTSPPEMAVAAAASGDNGESTALTLTLPESASRDITEPLELYEEICDVIAAELAALRDELRARVRAELGIDIKRVLGAYD